MTYKFCRKERTNGDWFIEIDLDDRTAALDYVQNHLDGLGPFADRGTGNIYGYCTEQDGSGTRARALLYSHPEHGLLWIDVN